MKSKIVMISVLFVMLAGFVAAFFIFPLGKGETDTEKYKVTYKTADDSLIGTLEIKEGDNANNNFTTTTDGEGTYTLKYWTLKNGEAATDTLKSISSDVVVYAIRDYATNNGIQYEYVDGHYKVFSSSSTLTNANIKSAIDGFAVTHIQSFDCAELQNITIPATITNIESTVFDNCEKLENINTSCDLALLPESSLDKLSEVVLPQGITKIEKDTFYKHPNLKSIVIPEGVTSIEYYAFNDCINLTSIVFPSSVTSIGYCVIGGCDSLTKITVDENNPIYDSRNNCNAIIKTSENTLIAGCKNTIIPNTVTVIGSNAFYMCSGLSDIEIPSSVVEIEFMAFNGCTGLNSIVIPEGVTTIGHGAFYGCTSLESLTLPESLTKIEYGFIDYCPITEITIPANVVEADGIFTRYCTNLKNVYIEDKKFFNEDNNNIALYSELSVNMYLRVEIVEEMGGQNGDDYYISSSLNSYFYDVTLETVNEKQYYKYSPMN